jgi:hypothetical protein
LLFFGAMVICGCQQHVWFWCIPTTQKSHLLKDFQDTHWENVKEQPGSQFCRE